MSSGDFEVGQEQRPETTAADQAQTMGEDEAPRVRFVGGTPPPAAGAFHEPGVSASDLAFGEEGCHLCNVPPQTRPAPAGGHLSSHEDPYAPKMPADEQPVDWTQYADVTAPPDPFVVRDIIPAEVPPAPPDTVVQWHSASELYGHGEARSPGLGDAEKVHVDASHMDQRLAWWDAYRAVATQVDGVQRDVAPDIDLFRHAERNPELRALGFMLPHKGWEGNLEALAEDQQVPKRGGPSVGSLFAGGGLRINAQEDRAIASAGQALQQGRGGGEAAFLETERTDNHLKSAVEGFKGAVDSLDAARGEVDAVADDLRAEAAAREVSDAQAEIASLTGECEATTKALAFAAVLPKQLHELGVGPGAIAESALGTVANSILSLVPDERVLAAQSTLADAMRRLQDARADALRKRLEDARTHASSALHELAGKRFELLSRLTERREAYDRAGLSAAAGVVGTDAGKHKVAASISSIPIVESVVGAIRRILGRTVSSAPVCTQDAALGYGIALNHRTPESIALPVVIGQLVYVNEQLEHSLAVWQRRLDALLVIKDRIAGPRPQGQEG